MRPAVFLHHLAATTECLTRVCDRHFAHRDCFVLRHLADREPPRSKDHPIQSGLLLDMPARVLVSVLGGPHILKSDHWYHYSNGTMGHSLTVATFAFTDAKEGHFGLACVPGSYKTNSLGLFPRDVASFVRHADCVVQPAIGAGEICTKMTISAALTPSGSIAGGISLLKSLALLESAGKPPIPIFGVLTNY